LTAGKLGIDARPGVGLDADGLPDIQWCSVDPGRVVLEGGAGEFEVAAFAIAKYPVTNAQFQAFIDAADGYRDPSWWEPEWRDAGWVDLDASHPSSWTEPNAPRETVSWHEAVAFCRWLDFRRHQQRGLPKGQQIRLPTEWEWQQAATGGDPERTYPWGPRWEPENLNAGFTLGRTTAVGLYLAGQSPCGALDMAGNVWEWCLNPYGQVGKITVGGVEPRVVRGGAWIDYQNGCRAAYRYWFDPVNRFDYIGFRLCLSSPIMEP
jgi:formylglycine-generating enzyme required for sulfatase activity